MLTDIEIAQSVTPKNILDIAREAGIDEKYIEIYFKDNELRTSIMTIIDTLELSYKIKNTYNDTRTSMEIC